MEENTLPARLLFTAAILDSVLDHFSLINEHQIMAKNLSGVSVATM